jgi:hypothetical protein
MYYRTEADEEELNRSESHATAIATMAPKTSAPENMYVEKLWATSQCIAQ